MKVKRAKSILLAFAIIFALVSCNSSPKAGRSQGPSLASAESPSPRPRETPKPPSNQGPSAPKDQAEENKQSKGETTSTASSDYYRANAPTILQFTLDNGIPVVIKKNASNRIFALKTILRGTSAIVPPEKAGLEALTLRTMARGSATYDYDRLSALSYYKSSTIASVSSAYDYSSFDLITFDKYFDETFEAYASCFLEPSFLEADFNTVLTGFRAARAKTLSDPYSYATSFLHQATFKGHPYASDPQGTDESIASFTLADLRGHYENFIGAERLAIVAVGDFDQDLLKEKLNASFGRIAKKTIRLPEVKRYEARRELILAPFPKSPGIGYVRGDFPIPLAQDKDYIAYALGTTILTDLLFDVVRTKYGACYTPFASTYGFQNPYGSIGIYKTSKLADIKQYIDESIAILASGRGPNLKNSPGLEYAPISQTLEAYKAKYVNVFFDKQQTNIEIAGQIAHSMVVYGRPDEYLKVIDKLKQVKAEDVVRTLKKYVIDGKISWIVVSDQAGLDSVKKEDWTKFTGK